MPALSNLFRGAALVLLMAACAAGGSPPLASGPDRIAPPASGTPGLAASPTQAPSAATDASPSPIPVSAVTQIDGPWWASDGADGPSQLTIDAAQQSWRTSVVGDRGGPSATGTFTFAEGVLTWQEGWPGCPANAMGSYELLLSADAQRLTFVVVGDECPARESHLRAWPTWLRGEPPR